MLTVKDKGILLVLATAFISGFSIFINKFGVSVINPYIFTGLKNTLVAVFLFSLLLALGKMKELRKLEKRDWLALSFIGLIGGCIPFLLFFKGLSLTNATQAAFIHKEMFLFIAVFAFFLLRERIEKKFIIGALLLLLGNVFLNKAYSFNFDDLGIGALFILLATLFWSLESVISKKILERLSSNIVAFGRMFFGSLLIMVFLVVTGQINLLAGITTVQIGWVLITSVFLLGYTVTWYAGLKNIPAHLAASILVLGAPITSLISLLSGGSLKIEDLAGVILIILGVIVTIGMERFLRINNRTALNT